MAAAVAEKEVAARSTAVAEMGWVAAGSRQRLAGMEGMELAAKEGMGLQVEEGMELEVEKIMQA